MIQPRAQIKIEVDSTVDAAYIRLSSNHVVTTEAVTDDVMVDLDAMRVVVGIEVLSLNADIPFSTLVTKYHVHSDVIELLRRVRPTVAGFVFSMSSESSSKVTSSMLMPA